MRELWEIFYFFKTNISGAFQQSCSTLTPYFKNVFCCTNFPLQGRKVRMLNTPQTWGSLGYWKCHLLCFLQDIFSK